MLYKLYLDADNYLLGFEHTGTSADVFFLDPAQMELDYVTCYHLIDNQLWLDEVKKDELIKEKEKEEKRRADINEQTLRLAEMFVEMGVDANEFIDRLDAQTLYTALMTDTLIESEDNLNE